MGQPHTWAQGPRGSQGTGTGDRLGLRGHGNSDGGEIHQAATVLNQTPWLPIDETLHLALLARASIRHGHISWKPPGAQHSLLLSPSLVPSRHLP